MVNLDERKIYGDIINNVCLSAEMGCESIPYLGIPERTAFYDLAGLQKKRSYSGDDRSYCFDDLQILRKSGKGRAKAYVLTKAASECGLLEYYDMQQYYDEISRPIKERSKPITRRKSKDLSVIFLIMKKAGVKYLPSEKKLPFLNDFENDVDCSSYFYSFREIRKVMDHYHMSLPDNGIAYGQYFGFLITQAGNYVMYTRNEKSTRFNIRSEQRTAAMASSFHETIMPGVRNHDFKNAVYIIENDAVFFGMLDCLHQHKYDTGRVYQDEFAFPAMHTVPLIRMISIPGYKDIIKRITFKADERTYGTFLVPGCDGITREGELLMTAFDCNLNKIRRFSLAIGGHPNEKYSVACFDWQEKILREFIKADNINFKTVSPERFFSVFQQKLMEMRKKCKV